MDPPPRNKKGKNKSRNKPIHGKGRDKDLLPRTRNNFREITLNDLEKSKVTLPELPIGTELIYVLGHDGFLKPSLVSSYQLRGGQPVKVTLAEAEIMSSNLDITTKEVEIKFPKRTYWKQHVDKSAYESLQVYKYPIKPDKVRWDLEIFKSEGIWHVFNIVNVKESYLLGFEERSRYVFDKNQLPIFIKELYGNINSKEIKLRSKIKNLRINQENIKKMLDAGFFNQSHIDYIRENALDEDEQEPKPSEEIPRKQTVINELNISAGNGEPRDFNWLLSNLMKITKFNIDTTVNSMNILAYKKAYFYIKRILPVLHPWKRKKADQFILNLKKKAAILAKFSYNNHLDHWIKDIYKEKSSIDFSRLEFPSLERTEESL